MAEWDCLSQSQHSLIIKPDSSGAYQQGVIISRRHNGLTVTEPNKRDTRRRKGVESLDDRMGFAITVSRLILAEREMEGRQGNIIKRYFFNTILPSFSSSSFCRMSACGAHNLELQRKIQQLEETNKWVLKWGNKSLTWWLLALDAWTTQCFVQWWRA